MQSDIQRLRTTSEGSPGLAGGGGISFGVGTSRTLLVFGGKSDVSKVSRPELLIEDQARNHAHCGGTKSPVPSNQFSQGAGNERR